ncbi:MAG: hypothetical protein R3272_04535 [Candidatus Promineifilaceae bacterium]|nr:hypothetical protein [Candidatus Promineifilaceae bacterium]
MNNHVPARSLLRLQLERLRRASWLPLLALTLLVLSLGCQSLPGAPPPSATPLALSAVEASPTAQPSPTPSVTATPAPASPTTTPIPPTATVAGDVSQPEAEATPVPFCEDPQAREVVARLREALAEQDAVALRELIDAEQGLAIYTSWWNPEVRLPPTEVERLFTESETVYEWGREDGSGNLIQGSFSNVILPLLEADLLPATEVGCNEILHGSTAGLVRLPETREGANFYSLYRPAPEDGFELDWGTWVVGLQRKSAGTRGYVVSFLVHVRWEI